MSMDENDRSFLESNPFFLVHLLMGRTPREHAAENRYTLHILLTQ